MKKFTQTQTHAHSYERRERHVQFAHVFICTYTLSLPTQTERQSAYNAHTFVPQRTRAPLELSCGGVYDEDAQSARGSLRRSCNNKSNGSHAYGSPALLTQTTQEPTRAQYWGCKHTLTQTHT